MSHGSSAVAPGTSFRFRSSRSCFSFAARVPEAAVMRSMKSEAAFPVRIILFSVT